MNEEVVRELTETTARSKSNTKRLDRVEEQQRLMYEMNKNIAVIAEQTKDTKEDVKALKTDVEEIKSKPNKLVDKMKENVLWLIISTSIGIIGAVIGMVL